MNKAPAAFTEALAHQNAWRLSPPITAYQRVLAADPRHVGALLNLASLWANSHPTAARALYKRALSAAPSAVPVLKSYGLFRLAHGEPAEAKRLLAAAAGLVPDDAEIAFHLGNFLQAEGAFFAAATHYQRAAAPTVPEIHNNLAAVLIELGQPDAAVAAEKNALSLRPTFAAAANTLGSALAARGEFERAAAAYKRVLEADPALRAARVNRAQMEIELGQLEHARRDLETFVAADPSDLAALSALGLAEQRYGRHEQAIALFDRVLARAPRYLQAINNRAISEMALGRHEEALDHYRLAVDRAPSSGRSHVNLGHALQTWAATPRRPHRFAAHSNSRRLSRASTPISYTLCYKRARGTISSRSPSGCWQTSSGASSPAVRLQHHRSA